MSTSAFTSLPLRLPVVAALAMACLFTGCVAIGKPKTAVVPPAPKPAAAPASEEPLSVPQTVVVLPAPQPIPPESLPPLDPIPVRTAGIVPTQPPAGAKRAQPRLPLLGAPNEVPPVVPDAIPAEIQSSRPRFEAADGGGDALLSVEKINERLAQVKQLVETVGRRKLTPETRIAINRVDSFVKLSRTAIARGDLRQANALSERALIMVRDLARER